MDESISKIINDEIDIFQTLGVSQNSTSQEIRRSYRQKALQFHPDKYQGDETKFNLILTCYEILKDPLLRKRYQELYNLKSSRISNREKLDELTKKFQDELIESEKKKKQQQQEDNKHKYDIESLKEDGLKRRRLQEQKLMGNKNNTRISIYDLPLRNNFTIIPPQTTHTVLLKYKYKKDLKGLIDENVISKIMSIFGNVNNVKMDGHDDRYGYAYVDFQSEEGCSMALQHNYNESAKRWDGTDVRKLASLLRDCKKINVNITTSELTANDKVNQILQKFLNVNSVSDKNTMMG